MPSARATDDLTEARGCDVTRYKPGVGTFATDVKKARSSLMCGNARLDVPAASIGSLLAAFRHRLYNETAPNHVTTGQGNSLQKNARTMRNCVGRCRLRVETQDSYRHVSCVGAGGLRASAS